MANTCDKVIDVALSEVGYLEKKNGNNLYDKTANAGSNNYTKYGKEMHNIYPAVMDYPAYWCDAFVDWCFYKAYGVSTAKSIICGNFDDYTVNSCQMYKNKDALGTKPKKGAQVFFTRNGQVSGCHHTGLVYKVDDTYFYTVEGNTSGASGVVRNGGGVAKKKYSISAYKGKVLFGYPKYDSSTKVNKTVDTSSVLVELNKTVKWTGVSTTDNLNVRRGAGTQFANLSSYSSIDKNKEVGVCDEIKALDGTIWYYVVIDGSKGKKYGFVNSKYISKKSIPSKNESTKTPALSTSKAPKYKVGSVYTLQKRLQVYASPGSSSKKKNHNQLTADGQKHDSTKSGKLDKGTKITCKELKTLSNGNIWMKSPSGWLCAFNESKNNVNIK